NFSQPRSPQRPLQTLKSLTTFDRSPKPNQIRFVNLRMSSSQDDATNTAGPSNGSPSGPAPTPKEAMFFLSILNNMKNKPEVDWDVVAAKSGFNSGKTAATRFGQIKKKWSSMSSEIDTSSSTPKAKTPKKGKGSGTNTTPSKVTKASPTPKKRGRKPKVKAEEEEVEEEAAEAAEVEMKDASAEDEDVVVEEAEFYEAEEVEVYEEA
ncbi:hypothetical protein V8E51_006528, partial [Hyaloscypha variabilis]